MSRVDNLEVKVQPALQIFTQQLIKVKLKWKNAFLTHLDHIFSHALRLFSNICQIKNPFLCILISKSNISPKHFGCGPAGYFEESGIYESSRLCRRHFTLDSFSIQWDRSLYPVGFLPTLFLTYWSCNTQKYVTKRKIRRSEDAVSCRLKVRLHPLTFMFSFNLCIKECLQFGNKLEIHTKETLCFVKADSLLKFSCFYWYTSLCIS